MLTIIAAMNDWAEGWLRRWGRVWQPALLVAAGGPGRVAAAAVVAGRALLAVADRGDQTAADAVLDVCRSDALVG